MPRYRKKIWSGDVFEIEEYYSPRAIGKKYERGKNEMLTTKEQLERNLRIARKKLARLVNANFKAGDLFLTLTHEKWVNRKDAKRLLANFIERLRRQRKKDGLPELKYIVITESEKKRVHHHVLINRIDRTAAELRTLWGLGRIDIKPLEAGADKTAFAQYITKESVDRGERRWSPSRNLTQPKVEVLKLASARPKKRPQAPKGYHAVEYSEYFSEEIGAIYYLKAIRIGGTDFGEGKERKEE